MFFRSIYCTQCGEKYDSAAKRCPHCKKENSNPKVRSWEYCTPLGVFREIGVLLMGTLGLSLFATIIALASGETTVTTTNLYISYALLFLVLCLIVWNNWRPLLGLFKNGRTYWGFLMGFIVIVANLVYSSILARAGFGSNNNQETLTSDIGQSPLLSFLILAVVGPICEEITYRLGLFNLTKRVHPVVGYIATALIFGFIHFDWQQAGSLTEWVNLPNYIIAGALLCFTYDRFGFGASVTAHVLNNTIALLLTFLAAEAA